MKKVHYLLISLGIVLSFQTIAKGTNHLIVHEWGTFTSFMGSDGKLQEGLHHEDEPLPSFVFGMKKDGPATIPQSSECSFPSKLPRDFCEKLEPSVNEYLPEAIVDTGITQKMETPVIYFYGYEGMQVDVDIKFPKGIITQYYPQASLKKPTNNELLEVKDGHFKFNVTLGKNGLLSNNVGPKTLPESIWNPARLVPNANSVTDHLGNKEKFIFYRGVGDFESPLSISSIGSKLVLKSLGGKNISKILILNSDGIKGNFKELSNVKDIASALVPKLGQGLPFDQYISVIKEKIVGYLIADGLFIDEAKSMVNTWEKSYFHTPGIRALYILPKEDIEEILPLAVTPLPAKIERSLVGRIEIMTDDQEKQYLKLLQTQSNIDVHETFGRFFEPKLRRLLQIASPEAKEIIRNLL